MKNEKVDYTGVYIVKIDKLEKEIERLNNIINELEKWLDKKEKLTFNLWNKGIHEVQRKLQELKGSGKEWKYFLKNGDLFVWWYSFIGLVKNITF